MHTADIRYRADGRTMVGYLAYEDHRPGRRPAVLVAHEGPGLDAHAKGTAERLAGLGYVAFALDYNGAGARLPMDQAAARIAELISEPDRAGQLGLAGLEVLLGQEAADPSRAAVIGYCFGAVVSLELARTGADVKAVVGFHPGYTPPRTEASRKIRASVLVCSGTDDPFATAAQRADFEDEMRQAGVADWRLELYGGVGHSFTNPAADQADLPGIAYDARADRRSWRSALALFDEVLRPADECESEVRDEVEGASPG
ncbi:MAG: dienelactone hydrolase family protein [Trebonia sp.]